MNKKIIALVILSMFLLSTLTTVGIQIKADNTTKPEITLAGNTIYVDDDAAPGGDGSEEHPFQTITEGINAADNGDTVFVFMGNYKENIEEAINKCIKEEYPSEGDYYVREDW